MHSVAKLTAVSKPNVTEVVVDRLRHAHHRQAALVQMVGDGERPVAADGDERIDAVLGEPRQQLVGAVDLDPRTVGLLDREAQRVAAVGGAEHRAAQVGDAAHRLAGEGHHAALRVLPGREQPVVAVANAHHLPPAVQGRDGGGTDDGIEARGVATTGAERDAAYGHVADRTPGALHPLRYGCRRRVGWARRA
jgi:hypothetical protein